MKWRLGMTGVM